MIGLIHHIVTAELFDAQNNIIETIRPMDKIRVGFAELWIQKGQKE